MGKCSPESFLGMVTPDRVGKRNNSSYRKEGLGHSSRLKGVVRRRHKG